MENQCLDRCKKEQEECTGYCEEYRRKFNLYAFGGQGELGYVDDFLNSKGNEMKNEPKRKRLKKEKFNVVKIFDEMKFTSIHEDSESQCTDY